MPSLVDQFCPNVHDSAITAAAYDPFSGTMATADASGLVAVQRRGESAPGMVFQPGGPITGSLCLVQGGSLVAVGDENGTVGVYRTDSRATAFLDERDAERGRVRAMRGIALDPSGTRCATIAVDGLLRMWDIVRQEREVAWQGFSGSAVEFDPRGERLLCMDKTGQPRLVDLRTHSGLPMDHLQMPAERACFTRDGTMVLAVGASGISLLRVVDGQLVGSYATRGGSGILNLVLSPEGDQAAVVTQRSVHVFSLPDLQPASGFKHGAPSPTGAAIWTSKGIRVAGNDGLLHGGSSGVLGPVTSITGYGDYRVVAHAGQIAVWERGRRIGTLKLDEPVRQMSVDREGRVLGVLPDRGTLKVYDLRSMALLFDGGPATQDALTVDVGGPVVLVSLPSGGIRWWQLERNQAYDLTWPRAATLSGSGTWLGVVTPKGAVRILDPLTGQDAVRPPRPLADSPIRNLAFVNRRADLLVVDEEGVLGHYDLAAGIRTNSSSTGRDVLDFGLDVDGVWGVTGGRYAAVRLPDNDKASIVVVDLATSEVVSHLTGLHRFTWVDEETGAILQPARASALLERTLKGEETRVLRSLPDDQWISYGPKGVIEVSEAAGNSLSR